MKRSLLLTVQVLLAVSLGLFAAGCGGGGGGGTATNKPLIRAFNASPDSNPVMITLGTDTVTTLESSLGYLATNSVFHEEKAKTYDVETFDSVTNASLWADTTTLANNNHYLAVVFGLENFGSETLKRAQSSEFQVDLTAPVGDKATLIVFHGFNRAAGFDTPGIDFQNPGENPQFVLTNIGYGTSQTITVDSGNTLTFQARQTGTEQVFTTSTPTLAAGGVYLVVVSGVENQSGTEAPAITYVKLN